MENINFTNEIWKPISNIEFYFISNLGRVKSTKFNKEKILKEIDNGLGYKFVNLFYNKKRKTKYIHRLVAEEFIINLSNKPHINHVDGNKNNNNTNNLEWVTEKENRIHYIKYLKNKI